MRTERDNVDLSRPCATQVSNDEAYHTSESGKRALASSRGWRRQLGPKLRGLVRPAPRLVEPNESLSGRLCFWV
jgi:hypothetical protein